MTILGAIHEMQAISNRKRFACGQKSVQQTNYGLVLHTTHQTSPVLIYSAFPCIVADNYRADSDTDWRINFRLGIPH